MVDSDTKEIAKMPEPALQIRVAFVEDEPDIREVLQGILDFDGFAAFGLADGNSIIQDLERISPDVLLLDQMLPGNSGDDIVRELRLHARWKKLPIIMVTGMSGDDEKVNSFELGVDDYITKPFYPKELTARIRALHRRNNEFKMEARQLEFEGIKIDLSSQSVNANGRQLQLTLTEFKILTELIQNTGRVLSRESIRTKAFGSLNITDRNVDVHVAALRKKLGESGTKIHTVRGLGYKLAS